MGPCQWSDTERRDDRVNNMEDSMLQGHGRARGEHTHANIHIHAHTHTHTQKHVHTKTHTHGLSHMLTLRYTHPFLIIVVHSLAFASLHSPKSIC